MIIIIIIIINNSGKIYTEINKTKLWNAAVSLIIQSNEKPIATN